MSSNLTEEAKKLSIAERINLVEEIWDSIAEEANVSPDVLPLSDEQKAELDRRIAELDADPSVGVPIDEVIERVEAKLRRPR